MTISSNFRFWLDENGNIEHRRTWNVRKEGADNEIQAKTLLRFAVKIPQRFDHLIMMSSEWDMLNWSNFDIILTKRGEETREKREERSEERSEEGREERREQKRSNGNRECQG